MSNRRSLHLLVCLTVLGLTGCNDSSGLADSAPVELEAVSPAALVAAVDTRASPSPSVRVKARNGRPIPGVTVTFAPLPGSGVAGTASTTDADGIAAVSSWTLGSRVGFQSLEARVSGIPPVVFVATAVAGPFTTLTIVDGDKQNGISGIPLLSLLSVRTTDRYGNPVKGVSVTFAVISGDGRIEGGSAISDTTGTAVSGQWRLGATPRTQYAVARAGDKEVVFQATLPSAPCDTTCLVHAIAFERSGRVMVTAEDGSKLTDVASGKTPSWSPDGSKLVYTKSDTLWILNVRTGTTTALGKGLDALDSHPSWSPDGKSLAFFRFWIGPDQSYLVAVNVNDGSERVLAMWWPVEGRITWSPDGLRVAFTCEGSPPRWESDICIVPSNGNAGYFYTAASNPGLVKVMIDTWVNSDPSWKPDGTLLAFTTNRLGAPHIALIKPDGTGFTKLVPGHHPSWSRDGSQIVFAGNSNTPGLHVMKADGTGVRQITDNPADTAPSWK